MSVSTLPPLVKHINLIIPMRRFSLFTLLLLSALVAAASPVIPGTARDAGRAFLLSKGLIQPVDTLDLAMTYASENGGFDCFYAFNFSDNGFVLVSADTRCTPILGYSTNGNFAWQDLPENAASWFEDYRSCIERGILSGAPEDPETAAEWKELLNGNVKPSPAAKDDTYLLTSTWEQGSGYNNYCPVMNGEHVVVGCVATAMAQIIRFWGYPNRGFGHSGYNHTTYGHQEVNFDTTDYDYSLMPDHLTRRSSAAERDMVSRLCYHCGVTVHMNYQNPEHTSGSGAQSSHVPEGLLHFGYTDTRYVDRGVVGDDVKWRVMIRNEIDAGRPIYYSGSGTSGGHAFVLDGYSSQNRFHFNWGWGGYSDGFYTLSTMQGFTANNDMVINIYPSGWDGHAERFYVSPDGHGDGTSWQSANNNVNAAAKLANITGREIWMKEGVYYGDTTADYAFSFVGAMNLYGGFAGTEEAVGDRDAASHPTILDGQGRRPVLHATTTSSYTMKINDIGIEHGYSADGECIKFYGSKVFVDRLTVRHCNSDNGRVASLEGCRVRYSRFEANSAPLVCLVDGGTLRQSLIAQNDATALRLASDGRVVNSTIVANAGHGVQFTSRYNSFVNNIVWGNDSCVSLSVELPDTSVRHCAFDNDSIAFDSLSFVLSAENNAADGPRFLLVPEGRGSASFQGTEDWRLAQGSICINAGERLTESMRDGDMTGAVRCRQGSIDLGCYETNYATAIDDVPSAAVRVYPNPATDRITVVGGRQGAYTLHDALGRKVGSWQKADTPTLSLAGLAAGVYFLHTPDGVFKIVKR